MTTISGGQHHGAPSGVSTYRFLRNHLDIFRACNLDYIEVSQLQNVMIRCCWIGLGAIDLAGGRFGSVSLHHQWLN